MILQLKGISKSFNKNKILESIDFSLKQGEILTILGSSGSGKSTILNLISGFEEPDSGTISIYGECVSSDEVSTPAHKRNVGFVFQNYALFPHLKVSENIAFGLRGMDVNRQKRTIKNMLTLCGLEGLDARYPHELSGGQQQRVALARTLATQPQLILFDEAFSNIDTVLKSRIEKELVDIIKDSGVSAIFVTHDSKEALSISDKIAYLEEGKIVQLSSAYDIYNSPLTKTVASFFGKANFIKKAGKEYCVRPEECHLHEKSGKIYGQVDKISFQGERFELEVYFEFEGQTYCFVLYAPKGVDIYNKKYLSFDIDWDNASEITGECIV